MAESVSDFYTGIISPNGGLFTPQPGGIYDGIYGPANTSRASDSGLISRNVKTVSVDPRTGMPILASASMPSWGAANPNQGNGPALRELAQSLESAPSQRWAVDASGARVDPAVLGATQTALAGLFGRGQPATPAARPQVAANPGDGGLFGIKQTYFPEQKMPPGVAPTKWAASSAVPIGGGMPSAPAAPAASLAPLFAPAGETRRGTNGYTYTSDGSKWVQSASNINDPARVALGLAIGEANRKSANPTRDFAGNDNSFSPKSMQDSARWQTGI